MSHPTARPKPKKALAYHLAAQLVTLTTLYLNDEEVDMLRAPDTRPFSVRVPFDPRWDALDIWRMALDELARMVKYFGAGPSSSVFSAVKYRCEYEEHVTDSRQITYRGSFSFRAPTYDEIDPDETD